MSQSGQSKFTIGVISGSNDGQIWANDSGPTPRTSDLGGLVVSGSLTVLGMNGPAGTADHRAPGITGSLTVLPDGSALIRSTDSSATIITGSVQCGDNTGRSYAYVDITVGGGTGDVTMSSDITVTNVMVTTDGTSGKAVKQVAAATVTTGESNIHLDGDSGNNSPYLALSCNGDANKGEEWRMYTENADQTFRITNDKLVLNTFVDQVKISADAITDADSIFAVIGDVQVNGNSIMDSTGEARIEFAGGTGTGMQGTLEVKAESGQNSSLKLLADLGAETGDEWTMSGDAGGGTSATLSWSNDTSVNGTPIIQMTLDPGDDNTATRAGGVLTLFGSMISTAGQIGGKRGYLSGSATATPLDEITAGARSPVLFELGTAGSSDMDVVGASGILTIYNMDSDSARKTFNYTAVMPKTTSNDDQAIVTWTEASIVSGNVDAPFLANLTMEIVCQSSVWGIYITNGNTATVADGAQAMHTGMITLQAG